MIHRDVKPGNIMVSKDGLPVSFYESTLSLYTDQYGMFGDPEAMPVKVIWDYTYYWGVLCQLFFQHRLTDTANIARLSAQLSHAQGAEPGDAELPARLVAAQLEAQ